MKSLVANGPTVCLGAVLVAGLAEVPLRAKDVGDYLSYSWGHLALQPQLSVSEVFTDNLFLGPSTNQVSDLTSIISPGLKLQYGLDGENQINIDAGHDEILLLENSDKNTHQDRVGMHLHLAKSRLHLEGQDSIAFLSGFIGSVYNQSRTLVDRRLWLDHYVMTYDMTAKTDVYVIGDHSDVDYQEGLQLYDQNDLRGTLGTSYKYDPMWRFLVEGFYGQTALSPNAPTQPTAPYSVVYGGYVGARGDFTAKLSGFLRVGYEQRNYNSGQTVAAQTPAINLDITYAFRPTTVLNLTYSRSSAPSPQFHTQFQVVDAVGLSVSQNVGKSGRWLVRGHVRYLLSEFDAGGQPGVDLSRTDDYWLAGIALLYQPRAWITCSLAYDYENYSYKFADPQAASTFFLPQYQVNRVTLSVAIGY